MPTPNRHRFAIARGLAAAKGLAIAAGLAALVGPPAPSLAHDGDPRPARVVLVEPPAGDAGEDGDDATSWVLVTNFGVMTSETPQHYVCEEAFDAFERFEVEPLGLREWVVFTHTAVQVTRDGCTFAPTHTLHAFPVTTAAHPPSGNVAFVTTRDGLDELWVSRDRGASFARAGAAPPDVRLTSAHFLDADAIALAGFVATGTDRGLPRLFAVALETADWQPLDLTADARYPFLLTARDDQLVWTAHGDVGVRVFFGTLDDPTRSLYDAEDWPQGAAITPDGTAAWVAGPGIDRLGLAHAEGRDATTWTEHLPAHTAICAAHDGARLFVCGDRFFDGYDLGTYDGQQTAPLVNFNDLLGPVDDCPADSPVARLCPPVWLELAAVLDMDGTVTPGPGRDTGNSPPDDDTGLPEPDADVGTTDDATLSPPAPNNSDDGGICTTTPHNAPLPPPLLAIVAIATAAALLRRK